MQTRAPLLLLAALAACNNDPAGTTSGGSGGATETGTPSTDEDTGATQATAEPTTQATAEPTSEVTTETTAEPTGGDTSSDTSGSDGGETTAASSTTGETGDETTGGGVPLTRVEQVLAALDVAMYQCPERIWPDVEANYRMRQVLLASQAENRAWLWNDQQAAGEPPVVTEGPLDVLPSEWKSSFNVNQLAGVLTLGISLDYTAKINDSILGGGGVLWPDYATALTFHEGFHFLSDQNDWNEGNGDRTTPYPEPWEPRYLREQLKRSLFKEATSGEGLAAAAHWHGRLLKEHKGLMDKIRSYDCTEGSAEYVSLMMSALAELGCDASEEQLLSLAVSHLPDGNFVSEVAFSVSREPYDLGVLGGLILRREDKAGWELKVENGQAPVDQAVAGVAPVVQPDDPQVQAQAQQVVAARNAQVSGEIDPLIANMKDPAYTRLVLNFNWIAGSFGVGGFYYVVDDPTLSNVLLRLSAAIVPPSKVAITVDDFTAQLGYETPCALTGGTVLVLAVPTADLTLVGDKASVATAKLGFKDLAVEPTVDADALPWLCPVDAGGANGKVAPQPKPVFQELRTAPQQGGGTRLYVKSQP